ncbi:glycerol kinase 3 [Bacillus rossius redtenbacheri]|uniref:glycerol kinase 3 n=1 Tax=Bacillus rossius redtenbacheri TaxID=93214 RepID=UPI002FDE5BBC
MPAMLKKPEPLIGVIDQGTELARFVVYGAESMKEVASHTIDINQRSPREGWVEQDPMELIGAVQESIAWAHASLQQQAMAAVAAVGLTNQRETTVVWDRLTGEPLYNAIVWSDIRTASTVDLILAKVPNNSKNSLMPLCGLPISPYFSALKMRWLIDNVPAVRKAIKDRRCLFGTVDSWLVWNLTGGHNGGLHVTDVTNASRTMLMNINTLEWDPVLCRYFGIPMDLLPKICSSSEVYGYIVEGPLKDVPISGILGNQQAALVGEMCLEKGQAKSTYRDGCFLIYNTGTTRVQSTHGLATTIAYQLGPSQPPVYALEGSVAVAGSAMRWLSGKMRLLDHESSVEEEAAAVSSTGDVYFVPAFSGLYAPYWRKDARGIICGLTQFTTKQHIIRAALEAVCFQTRDILEAMHKDCGIPLAKLQVDGPLTSNNLLMQMQADLCGISVERSWVADTRAVGAASVAGSAAGIRVWNVDEQRKQCIECDVFLPTTTDAERDSRYNKWKMAVARSLGWVGTKKSVAMTDERYRLLASIPASWFLIASFGMLVLSGLSR